MLSRRNFISGTITTGTGLMLAPLLNPFGNQAFAQNTTIPSKARGGVAGKHYRPPYLSGMGGAPLGNNDKAIPDMQAIGAVEAAWAAGVRYFDTSPFYGYGLSERRFGMFLNSKPRKDYVLSSKVGRVFTAGKRKGKTQNWVNPSPFDYTYDYSASGTRRSIEDTLQRMGIDSLDIVLVHDLNQGNKDLGAKWKEHFEIAKSGAFKELTKMREEGLIKAWGLGVNESTPILETLKVADPDVMLAATQYSLMKHDEALAKTFPACMEKNVSIIVGAPLNNGFISGADRYDYEGKIPAGYKEKRAKMNAIAKEHGIDLRTAGLQFCAAHPAVAAVIPGARSGEQTSQNHASMTVKIPQEFWTKLREQKLIVETAPIPGELKPKIS